MKRLVFLIAAGLLMAAPGRADPAPTPAKPACGKTVAECQAKLDAAEAKDAADEDMLAIMRIKATDYLNSWVATYDELEGFKAKARQQAQPK